MSGRDASAPDAPARPGGLRAGLSRLLRRETGFARWPAPRAHGRPEAGRHLMAGRFLQGGHLVEVPPADLWTAEAPGSGFTDAVQGFAWLDDLAAEGGMAARETARRLAADWVAAFGAGQGPGWRPDIAGRRLSRLVLHAEFLGAGQLDAPGRGAAAHRRTLARHMRFLSRGWRHAAPGVPRVEALMGLVLGALTLRGQTRQQRPALRHLGEECARLVDREGGIASRTPETLAMLFTQLTWCAEALAEAGRPPVPAMIAALAHMAPTLRALRHGDGSLARFHGGGPGHAAQLDAALASPAAGPRGRPPQGMAMGFARLARGRVTLILDAAAPYPASPRAHASTLAFELSSGRRHLVVNCGSGRAFGEKWARAGRATASHSTLSIDGHSSARLAAPAADRAQMMVEAPLHVQIERRRAVTGIGLMVRHDGYVPSHGLTHKREIELDHEGRTLRGEDTLGVQADTHVPLFQNALRAEGQDGIPYRIRFHLHPSVGARLDDAGRMVELMLPSGEPWVFRHEGSARLLLEPSVYFAEGSLSPLASKQIVLTSRAVEYANRVSWTLAKAYGSPDTVRDLDWDPSGRSGGDG
ncbi:heparinase II/III family protein [Profundibacterium mesophilum]|uniref:Heparinase II/III-like C-terminal domain-containing protein n=1 Tax=Profundibacterium mesophilum KAUST100406-0324 TaxID=1037889 RepID=A0A921TFM1_9RHOB|nr:heparinase II/III family protein [Profundibacterium mesophilum]KAF0676574.1 uncharacterized protein PMES_01306 [Profundibacterium mesophilum KAUST100406-0324]